MFGKFIDNFRNQFLQQTKSVNNDNHCAKKKEQKNDYEKSLLKQNETDSFTCNSDKGKSKFEQMWEEAQNKTQGRKLLNWIRSNGGQVQIYNDEPEPIEMYGIVKPQVSEDPTEPTILIKPSEPEPIEMYGIVKPQVSEDPTIRIELDEPSTIEMYGIIKPTVVEPTLEPELIEMYGIVKPKSESENPTQQMLNKVGKQVKSILDKLKNILKNK